MFSRAASNTSILFLRDEIHNLHGGAISLQIRQFCMYICSKLRMCFEFGRKRSILSKEYLVVVELRFEGG